MGKDGYSIRDQLHRCRITRQESSVTLSLESSFGVLTPINMSLFTSRAGMIILSESSCLLLSSSTSCSVNVTGQSGGSVVLSATLSGYQSATTNFNITQTYAYITNWGYLGVNSGYTQCLVGNGGIESNTCSVIIPVGPGALDTPTGVPISNGFAYITNFGPNSNSYTQCKVGENGIESNTCNTVTPTGSGALSYPNGIESESCNTIIPGTINGGYGITFSP